MKKHCILLLVVGLFLTIISYGQRNEILMENFEDVNSLKLVGTPSGSWKINNNFYVSPPNSYRGIVPNMLEDSIVLQTISYDFSGVKYVQLRFNHICKISSSDLLRVEYRDVNSTIWKPLPRETYLGESEYYGFYGGFNSESYFQWQFEDDLATPSNSWWKEEIFDLSSDISESVAEFRFVLKRGSVQGTQVSYGWLVDNVRIIGSSDVLTPPVVTFINSVPRDTVYSIGPYEINAKVKTATTAPIKNPWLKYTATNNGTHIATDSILMGNVSGDSLWRATIPAFVAGTQVSYAILGVDTLGNYLNINLDYFIQQRIIAERGTTGYVVIGTDETSTFAAPSALTFRYSWSRQLYTSGEIDAFGAGGLITELAWELGLAGSNPTMMNNQTCWMKAVSDTVLASGVYINPIEDGAVQVWQGDFLLSGLGWNAITLDEPFYLPVGMNLLIYWNGEHYNYPGNAWSWKYTNTSIYRTIFQQQDNAFPVSAVAAESYQRPNIRLYKVGINSQNNSASLHSIDMNDTIAVSPAVQVPVVVTVKNEGLLPLDSVMVNYTVNGGLIQSYVWKSGSGLLWDFNAQDTIGYYSPKINGSDTLVIWTSMPNNQYDTLTWDDTLTKIVYAITDISMQFVDAVTDTVSLTGPYVIKARIDSRSGVQLTNIPLHTVTILNGLPVYDTLSMKFDAVDNLWKGVIPNSQAGSTINYSITLTDIRNNIVTISEQYHIKETVPGEIIGYVYFAPQDTVAGGTIHSNFPIAVRQNTSWSRMLYINSELVGDINYSQPNIISKIAWYNRSASNGCTRSRIKVYMRSTAETTNSDVVYVDPIADGAVLLYDGVLVTQSSWNEITLTQSFYLPAEDNLMIYLEDSSGVACSSGIDWPVFTTSSNKAVFRAGTGAINAGSTLPFMRFAMESVSQRDTNSVALISIDSPAEDVVPSSLSIPIRVAIKNKGASNLTSCRIGWSVNGVDSPFVYYNRDLQEGFIDTITIGNYITPINKPDTIKIWVSMPNGINDLITYDDTLEKIIFGCQDIMSGDYRIGTSPLADIPTIERALARIKNCGISGKVTLLLEDGIFPESVDISQAANSMTTHDTLEIVSLSGNLANTIIRPTAGDGISLANNNNIIIRGITIDATVSNSHGIQFMDACTNVVIRDCKIMVPATATQVHGIHKASGATGILNNIYILNDTIEGGYTGISLNGANGNTSAYGRNIIVDSNIIQNHYYYGINIQYTDFTSVSYNTITNKESGGNSTWVGINATDCNGPIRGNSIIQKGTANPTGINLQNYNFYLASDNPALKLVINNEIILKPTGLHNGIAANANTVANISHNSILMKGTTGASRGINIVNNGSSILIVKNNNIVMQSPLAYPIYLAGTSYLHQWDIDYNNMYAPEFVGNISGNAAGNVSTIEQWQYTVTSDKHSVSVLPIFTDTAHLKPANYYAELLCERIPLVNFDIDSNLRKAKTTMGCYDVSLAINASLIEIMGLRGGIIAGQTDSIKLVLFNNGTDSIKSVNLEWAVNENIQNAGGTVFTASLAKGEFDTLTLGELSYLTGDMAVEVWINSLNGSASNDNFKDDDTLRLSSFVCNNNLNGVINIGKTRELTSIDEALSRLLTCGVNGDITLVLDSGLYEENWNFSDLDNIMGGYTLTITSFADSVNDVILHPVFGVGIRLSNTRNFILKGITVDALTAGSHGIHFLSACSNIVIRDCKIKAINTTNTVGTASAIYKANSTGLLNNIFIINNTIDGGAAGVYIYGGTGSANFGTNIIVDSNRIQNQYIHGIYLYYVDFVSAAYNILYSRTPGGASEWNGIYMQYCNGLIVSNRIIQMGTANPYGIRTQYFNYYLVHPDTLGLIANNEIILSTTGTYYGMYLNTYTRANVLHNSIYFSGTSGAARGIYYNYNVNNRVITKNNNIVMRSPAAHPIYVASATNIKTLYEFDYNNMYAPQYVGYAGGNISNIPDWQDTVAGDTHSVKVLPEFVDIAANLKIKTYNDSLSCPQYPGITTDIDGKVRPQRTTRGASQIAFGQDLMLVEVSNWRDEVIENQTVNLSVDVLNLGSTSITEATLGWSVNGEAQQPSISWTPSPALEPFEQRSISIGQFPVIDTNEFDIIVWIETINSEPDTVKQNDTVSVHADVQALAEFVSSLPDTITGLSFDVHTLIRSFTGAPVSLPEMNLVIINEGLVLYDTVEMIQDINDVWIANISQAYSNSKIIYSITVSDTIGNTIDLVDSTFLKYTPEDGIIYDYENNLAVLSLVEPVNTVGEFCTPDYSPVKIALMNHGKRNYDFSANPLTVNFQVEGAILFNADTILNKGILRAGMIDTIELTDMMPVYPRGQYDVTIWLSSSLDDAHSDDTIRVTYISERINLPVDEDFSSPIMPLAFTSTGTTSDIWKIVSRGAEADSVIRPGQGTGMLSFGGAKGAMSNLSTRQLRLQGTQLPILEFWYFHDTIESEDYTDVRIILDENANYIPLLSLIKQDTVRGWKRYEIDLSPYIYGSCISILFESMAKSADIEKSYQYIDRIQIISQAGLRLSDIAISGLSACNIQTNELKVKRTTTTNQIIDFSQYNTGMQIEITGSNNFSYSSFYPLEDILEGDTSDIITVANDINFVPGTYTVKAYLTNPVDKYSADDTAKATIVINPEIDIEIEKLSIDEPATAEFEYKQKIIIRNIGNMELSDIGLILTITSDDGDYTFNARDTFNGNLQPNDTAVFVFDSAYIVPWSLNYDVIVHGYLICDSMVFNANFYAQEQVDIDDLYIVAISNPQNNTVDTVNSLVEVSVNIKNRSLGTSPYDNVEISLLLTDTNGNPITDPVSEYISSVSGGMEYPFTFSESYRVPEMTKYHLTVFIEQKDNYTGNDTMTIVRETTSDVNILERVGVSFAMEQNIPNPAKGNTIINYHIPQDGEIIFQIHTVSGQILYNKVENVSLGEHQIELNLSNYASGIYFYSMEYKGHRIVKRMSVK